MGEQNVLVAPPIILLGEHPPFLCLWLGTVSVFIAWTEWSLATALLWWQHYKYYRGYYDYSSI